MSVNVDQIGEVINSIYPLSGASSWDNSGFQINLHNNINKILVCVDLTKEVIREAAENGSNLIISHHPLLFHPIKKIDTDKYIDNLTALLIKNDISLYSAHTSADNAAQGINKELANIIGLEDTKFLEAEETEKFFKISVVVPDEKAEDIRAAIYSAGGGRYGKYKESSFTIPGYGEFMPTKGAEPYKGEIDKKEEIAELRIETLVKESYLDSVIKSVKTAHPYEEPVIDIFELVNRKNELSGIGIYGSLNPQTSVSNIIELLKEKLQLDKVRLRGNLKDKIKMIGICSGAGGEYVSKAAQLGAELFVTGEIKHNYYLESPINIIELGHYESEKLFSSMIGDSLQKALSDLKYNIDVCVSEKENAPYIIY